MAKIVIAGNAAVITSTKTLEDIKTLEKYNPKALILAEAELDCLGNPMPNTFKEVFKVATSSGKGSVSQHGVVFNGTSRGGDNFATVTITIPDEVEEVSEYVMDTIGEAIMRLNAVEANVSEALLEVDRNKAAVMAHVTII